MDGVHAKGSSLIRVCGQHRLHGPRGLSFWFTVSCSGNNMKGVTEHIVESAMATCRSFTGNLVKEAL